MIDWTKFRCLDYRPDHETAARLDNGAVVVFKPGGDVEWMKIKPKPVEGSYSDRVHVSVDSMTGCLVIDGNPVKYFQGHNVFGTWDLRGLVSAMFRDVVAKLGLPAQEADYRAINAGRFELLRVDVTENYSCGTLPRAQAVVASIGANGYFKHSRHGRGQMNEGTLYFRKKSRRLGAKVYAKGQEVEKHQIRADVPMAMDVVDLAQGLVRIEFVVRAMGLKERYLHHGAEWCDTTGERLYAELLEKLELPMHHQLPSETLDALPARLRLVYDAWLQGKDLRLMLSRPTFYRYRKELQELGVDIAVLKPSAERASNVLPLVQKIELRPAGIPAWAHGTGAYFEPRRTA